MTGAKEQPAALPANVSICDEPVASKLLEAKIYTRLTTTVQDSSQLSKALGKDCASFCYQHRNSAIIFDTDQIPHHEHFRQICLLLKDQDLGLQFGSCTFDAENISQAGFQLEKLGNGAVLVIDLQHEEDSDEDDEENGTTEEVTASG